MLAKEARAWARHSLQGHWALSLAVALVAAILGVGGSYGGNASSGVQARTENFYAATPGQPAYQVFLFGFVAALGTFLLAYGIVTLIIGGAVRLGLCKYNTDLVSAPSTARFGTLFSRFSIFGKAFLLQLVTGLFVFLWSLLFVIPGIIAAYRYSMAPYIMAQNPDIGVMEAINQSKTMMYGHKGRLFCLHLSFIGWACLAVLSFGIGFLWLNPYVYATEATFYLNLTGQLGAPIPQQPGGAPNT